MLNVFLRTYVFGDISRTIRLRDFWLPPFDSSTYFEPDWPGKSLDTRLDFAL